MERFPYKIIGGGAALLAVTTAFGWGGLEMVIRGQMKQECRILNGSDTYNSWQELKVPFYQSFYFFNIENPDDVKTGQKPKLTEKGPYVYQIKLEKVDILGDKENDTILYRQIRKYIFKPEMSEGNKDTDTITTLNVPFIAVAKMANEMIASTASSVDKFLSDKGEKLTVTLPVKQLLFDGYEIPNYVELANDNLVQGSEDFRLPELLADGKYALYKNKNGFDDGVYLIRASRNTTVTHVYGKIMEWNGMESLPFWKGDSCNGINGTDGTIFPPVLKNTTILFSLRMDICRSVGYVYEMTHEVVGVEAFRFRPPPGMYDGPEKNPDNWCYCPYEDASKCSANGVMNLGPCMEGIQLLASEPHFYGGDKDIIDSVEGLSPDKEKHETYIDMHAMAGLVLLGAKRMQYSMELSPISGMPSFGSLPKAYVPIVWSEETLYHDKRRIAFVKFYNFVLGIWNMVRWGLLALSIFMVLIGIVIALTRRSSTKVDRITLIQ